MALKALKYYFLGILAAVVLFVPVGLLLAGYVFAEEVNLWFQSAGFVIEDPAGKLVVPAGCVLLILGFALQGPLRSARIAARRFVEYDEYGLSKTKGDYEGLSKAERDAIDLQRTADMERLLGAVAVRKMTHQGPKDPLRELDDLVGLGPMKESVREMVARMQFDSEENRKKKRRDRTQLSGRHMCFVGAPGTGKTTTARIMTSFLHQYGYIKENKCIEIDGNFLKAGTESALKTELVLRHVYGGVLFIDEAYALMDSSDNSGEQVIATLIKQMEDQRGRFVLIIAGYTYEMKQLIEHNPGFESRIKDFLFFPDFDDNEMRQILVSMANKNGFTVDSQAFVAFDGLIARERQSKSFGNARTVRNILDKALDKHALNLVTGKVAREKRYILCAEDFVGLKIGGIDAFSARSVL